MTETATLITQLRVLAQLTRTEAQVARLRVTQANTDDVRDDLRQNAADADVRAARIVGTLNDLGALPDPVTPLIGRVATLVRGAVEQTQPLDEALLGDLALEHQLRDRARYVAALAEAADLPAVQALAADLEAAHTETVHWLTRVLTDLAGGHAALNASPLQQVAAQVTRAANSPARPALDAAAATVSHTLSHAVDRTAGTVTDAAGQVADTAVSAVSTGRDVAARTVDQVTRLLPGTEAPDTDDAPGSDTEPVAPPISGFADLPPHVAVAALRALDNFRDVAAMLEFEQSHGNRPGVVAAARLRATAVRR
ncbi:ferritin-like domain-containing protein [Pseudonocardia charpentierae]|uniref:Ferritin-like domain-containing protein n=1 Tax=Pseudonocardia charpentierae TaxID=3075545 RepID=A0ABU2NDZ3_9PSEU|nr:ferritin-like domain-containing protein [Pseudonocardia sp. DSM 45834]MDT0351955.1 ferritin-like domain-containing protein [Pseudonocardia sp. DSM 45834]